MEEVAKYESKPLTAKDIKIQVDLIQEVMKSVMKDKEHYGVIPGCGDKPALLKPGAEKLNLTFRMAPNPETEIIDMGNGHREYRVKCNLRSIGSGLFLGAGVGSASTMETKWRFRKGEQKCPKCGKEAIIKGKQEYGGGWLCFKKKGGCGEKFKDGDPTIENQEMGRVAYDNPADYYNTCWKMAKKRSLVDGVLTVLAASDIFTQDVEEMVENGTIPGTGNEGNPPPTDEKKESRETTKNKSVITPIMDVRKVKDSEWFRIIGLLDANEQSFSTKDIHLAESARKEKGNGLQFKIEYDDKFIIVSMAIQEAK